MSRVGKVPVSIPEGVRVEVDGLNVKVFGPKGELTRKFAGDIVIELGEKNLTVKPVGKTKSAKAMWGTARSIINGMVIGVKNAFTEELEINGVGYRAAVKGNYLNLTLGKSHNTKIEIPESIKVNAVKQNVVIVESVDKEKMGQFMATIIKQRPPEPYKGKGIKIKGQYVQRKEGKKS